MEPPDRTLIVSDEMPGASEFDAEAYLALHADVAAAIANGITGSAWQHYTLHGFRERRAWVRKRNVHAEVDDVIAAGDEMVGAREHYLAVGESALRNIELALAAANRPLSSIKRILDLPCGHGRVMRFLRRSFPHAELSACDLNADGVQFCARTFGATPIKSHVDPSRIALPGQQDLIWCGSLLTHLPEQRCAEFFELFLQALSPGGILVVTLHGRTCLHEIETARNRCGLDDAQVRSLLNQHRSHGFGYVDYANQPGYGISVTRPSFAIARFVERAEWELISYREAAWDFRQDVVAVRKR